MNAYNETLSFSYWHSLFVTSVNHLTLISKLLFLFTVTDIVAEINATVSTSDHKDSRVVKY